MQEQKIPDSWKNQPPHVQRKAKQILDALLDDGTPEERAIPIALAQARKFFQHRESFGLTARLLVGRQLSSEEIDDLWEYATVHNRDDRDAGELDEMRSAEKERVVRAWAAERGLDLQEAHRHDQCMRCDSPPTWEILWAEGRAHAWFCDRHLREFDSENPHEANKRQRIAGGKAGKRWGYNRDRAREAYWIQLEKTDPEVNYREAGDSEERCGTCRFFRMNSCALVEGWIEQSFSCDLWRERLPSQQLYGEHEENEMAETEIPEATVEPIKIEVSVSSDIDPQELADVIDEAVMDSAQRTGLPDSAFAAVYTDENGKKQRKLPFKDAAGKVDMPHLRNALDRINQEKTDLPPAIKAKAKAKLEAAAKTAGMREQKSDPAPDLRKVVEGMVQEGRPFRITEQMQVREQLDPEGTVWEVRCIASGMSLNRTYYSDAVLNEAVSMFSGVPCYSDHADGPRSINEVVGWFENPRFEQGNGVLAEFHALQHSGGFLEKFRESYDRGKSGLIGFSINGMGARHPERVDGQLAYVVDKIKTVESVDAVINPSAGGKVVRLVASESAREEEDLMALEELSLEELERTRPDLVEALKTQLAEAQPGPEPEPKPEPEPEPSPEPEPTPVSMREQVDPELQLLREETARLQQIRQEAEHEREVARCQRRLNEMLTDASLPQVVKDKIGRRFSGQIFKEEDVKVMLEEEEQTLRALAEERPISYPRIEYGEDQRDRAVKALDGLLKGEDVDSVPAARTLREAYALWKGLPTWGFIDAQQILRESWHANLTEGAEPLREMITDGSIGFTQWAEVLSDRIHKRLLELYRMPYLDDWRRIASSVIAVPDFKTQRRIRVGGYQNWGSVSEATDYATAGSPTDEEATYTVTKYGRLERLTLEAIANDDVGAVRRIPEQLARGAKHVIYEQIFDLLRKNSNVTYEAVALFNSASHTNTLTTGSTTVNLGDAQLAMAKRLLVEQTEKDSSKRLGLRARMLLVPPELEPIAMRLRDNEFAVSAQGGQGEGTTTSTPTADRLRDVNIHRNSFEYLVVPHWTDANRWFVLADPASVPTIEVGFYLGRQEPELFVQDMPNVGSMFNQDVLTYKGRVIFGAAVLDHRGFISANEATAT